MPHTASFKLDGQESDVKAMSYHFYRVTEENGRVAAKVRKGEITITIPSDDKHKEAIINWLAKPDQAKEGEIIIYEDDEKTKPFKTIKFENAFVIDYSESYDAVHQLNTRETFTISAEKITIGGAKFDFKWPRA